MLINCFLLLGDRDQWRDFIYNENVLQLTNFKQCIIPKYNIKKGRKERPFEMIGLDWIGD